jgi:hypothetical protein
LAKWRDYIQTFYQDSSKLGKDFAKSANVLAPSFTPTAFTSRPYLRHLAIFAHAGIWHLRRSLFGFSIWILAFAGMEMRV